MTDNLNYKSFSKIYRAWHWLNAIAILGLLATVLLRKTFLSYKTNAVTLQTELAKLDLAITMDAAQAIAKTIRTPMWEWHYIFGFALVALFVLRVILHFIDRSFFNNSELEGKSLHDRLVGYSYLLLYLLTFVMIVTGVVLYYKDNFGISKDLAKSIKEFHELLMFFFAFFAPLHIIGIFLAENRDQPGIVSNMISGKNSE